MYIFGQQEVFAAEINFDVYVVADKAESINFYRLAFF